MRSVRGGPRRFDPVASDAVGCERQSWGTDMTPTEPESRAAFFAEGTERARAMGNRGPLRFTEDGAIHPDILEAYWATGFYVFEQVIGPDELAEARADSDALLDRAPYPTKDSPVDRHGRPFLGHDLTVHPWDMAPPLSDPMGGSAANHGRHPFKMDEPTPEVEGPADVTYMVRGCLQHSEAFLRIFGHPGLLAMAEAVNGPDFTPFTEVLFVKEAGLGPSVAWHQDGQIHWDNPDWNEGIHGFNFQVQLYGSTAESGVWVLPGSHKLGKIDINALMAEAEAGERLPDAVPLGLRAWRLHDGQPPGPPRVVRQHLSPPSGDGELRIPPVHLGDRPGRQTERRRQSLRRRVRPSTLPDHRVGHRCPLAAVSSRDALPLPAIC